MPDALKLDMTTLNCLNYHWLWGLQYSKTPQPTNFGVEIGALLIDEAKINRLKEQQLNLFQKSALVRVFYWLFNIDNYAHHSYLLAACKAHYTYLCHSQEKNTAMEIKEIIIWAPLVTALAYAGGRIFRLLQVKTSKALPSSEQQQSSPSEPTHTKNGLCKVTNGMQAHLKELELHRNNGDSLSFVEVKSACRQKFLSSHPDKGGTNEAFCRVKIAAESLMKMMSSNSSTGAQSSYDEYYSASYAKNDAYIKELWAEFEAIKAENAAKMAEAFAANKVENAAAITAAISALREEMRTQKPTSSSTESSASPDKTIIEHPVSERSTAADKQKFFATSSGSNHDYTQQPPIPSTSNNVDALPGSEGIKAFTSFL